MTAIIIAAINDACGASAVPDRSDAARNREQDLARRWFADNGHDYRNVCTAAGFDPDALRTVALAYIDFALAQNSKQNQVSLQRIAAFHEARHAA